MLYTNYYMTHMYIFYDIFLLIPSYAVILVPPLRVNAAADLNFYCRVCIR
jgi:hypothetical protein